MKTETSGEKNFPECVRVPAILYSSDTNEPISDCLMCNSFLLQEGTSYMIEKAIRQLPELGVKETLFEYAMCMACVVKMNEALSEESRANIATYFSKHVDLAERSRMLMEAENRTIDSWIANCVIKNTPIAESQEFQIVAQCDGEHMVFTGSPFAISFEAINEISELLSAKSRGEIDDFIGKYFTGPPEVSEILKRRVVLV